VAEAGFKEMEMIREIPEEMAREFQQVAALVCQDVDILNDIASQSDVTLESLRAQVELLHSNKERAIKDKEWREMRFDAAIRIWGAVSAGLVRSEAVG